MEKEIWDLTEEVDTQRVEVEELTEESKRQYQLLMEKMKRNAEKEA